MTEKLQITVTLSADACPDLIKYLGQFASARERTFVFRLLAQRGLEVLGGASPVALLPAARLVSQPFRPEPIAASKGDAFPVDAPLAAQDVAVHDTAGPPATPGPGPLSADDSVGDSTPGASIADLDLGALNDAMARFI
ncbi:hypothetical protein [Cupriavidus sp. WS]|uniref:hypothetical protein n=1 Tax=Cupriavidus sp. WS TaxID=1312922 RepID=UPI0003758B71|nr:hypothetical protein [Cupriavidus sp. WS]